MHETRTRSIWRGDGGPSLARLRGAREADVLVVGAGITGLTTALLLAREGRSVIVVDSAKFGRHGTSHRTSAHVSDHPDDELPRLERRFGRDAMLRTMDAMRGAVDLIERLSRESAPDCDFRRVDAWRYSEEGSETDQRTLRDDGELARELGMVSDFHDAAPLPFATRFACRFGRQAAFHPVRYLHGLARAFAGQPGCHLHEETPVLEYTDGEPCRVTTEGGSIVCRDVVLATHSPIGVWLTLHTRLQPWRSSCIAVEVQRGIPDGLYWDMDDPYHYTRRVASTDPALLVVGGEDRKTGADEDPQARFDELSRFVGERFGDHRVLRRWSAEYFESADGLPYAGRAPGCAHIHLATGFSGAGLTFGTASAALMCDLVCGRDNPWSSDVSPSRVKPLASAGVTLAELGTTIKGIVGERLRLLASGGVEDIRAGEGRVVRIGTHAVAVHRDAQGEMHAHSAVCPHLGCLVVWNAAERQWECPCHGSVFECDGAVAAGPATARLAAAPSELDTGLVETT